MSVSGKNTGSRALVGELREFFVNPSANRNILIDYVKDGIGKGRESIALCFRGSYASLYYRCGQLLKIRIRNGKIVGEFNFRYALPGGNALSEQNELERRGVVFRQNDLLYRSPVYFILSGEGAVSCENLKFILSKYMRLIDSFIGKKSAKQCREKDRQQQLFIAKFGNSAETYFDIEYTEPRETLIAAGFYDYAEDKISAHKKDKGGRFDLLGLRRSGDEYILQFVELKSTEDACDGIKAGVEKHIKDYTRYCSYENLVNARKADAADTVNLLSRILGEEFYPDKITTENITGFEIVFIFTDGAVRRADRYKEILNANKVITFCYDGNLNLIR